MIDAADERDAIGVGLLRFVFFGLLASVGDWILYVDRCGSLLSLGSLSRGGSGPDRPLASGGGKCVFLFDP